VFWIAILAGVLFVWLAVRLGFYEMWVLLFNVVISIYVAIFLAPVFSNLASAAGGTASYGTALSLLVLAGGCFAALHGLSYVFLTSQFNIPFPRFFDILLSGLLGFAAGFLILSFAALVITTTPLAQHRLISSIGFNPQSQRANITCVAWCCDKVHSIAGFGASSGTAREAVERLFDKRHDPGNDGNQPSSDGLAQTDVSAGRPGSSHSETAPAPKPRAGSRRDIDVDID
jgi:hypothetical protein